MDIWHVRLDVYTYFHVKFATHVNVINHCSINTGLGLYHTADVSEEQKGQAEASQLKKHDQSESEEALYLPPLPPDQLDTVVKVTASDPHMYIHGI